MKYKLILGFLIVLAALALTRKMRRIEPALVTTRVTVGTLGAWSTYEGVIQARNTKTIMSHFKGSAMVIEVAPEGAHVNKGDVLVRFDSSQLERDIFKLESELAIAKSEIQSLENATLPLEIMDIEGEYIEVNTIYDVEKQYLYDTIDLQKEDLVSESEVSKQKLKVQQLKKQLESINLKLDLTKQYIHPSALEHAKSELVSAKQALDVARQQMLNSTITSPSDDIVVYQPIHIATEYRTIRVGDTIYQNQPFMVIPDMSSLVIHCYVPEAELSAVKKGREAIIIPVAYDDIKLHGYVETVASMAQSVSWRPNWQKYFHVVIAINDTDTRLRPGMSAHTHILCFNKQNVLLVPRTAVFWRSNLTYCKVVAENGIYEFKEITVGAANETNYEVISGLTSGDKVVLQ